MSDKRHTGDRGDDHELLRLAFIAAFRDRDFGDRQSVREDRREGRQASRDDRQEGHEARRDERQEHTGDRGTTTSCYALRLYGAAQPGFWEIGSRSETTAREGRQASRDDRQEGRKRRVGMSDKRRTAIGETTAGWGALRCCGAARPGFWRSAVGQRGTRARVARQVATIDKRGAEARRDERQEARGNGGDDHELLRLALVPGRIRDRDFGDRQSVREDRREGRQASRDDRQEGARVRRD